MFDWGLKGEVGFHIKGKIGALAGQEALAAAKERVARETQTARAALLPRADGLARDIASRLLGRKVA